MPVKVNKFLLPVDFVVMNVDEDKEVPLILGHQFLATSCALTDVRDGRIVLRA